MAAVETREGARKIKKSFQRSHKTSSLESGEEMAEEMFGGSLRLLLGTDAAVPSLSTSEI